MTLQPCITSLVFSSISKEKLFYSMQKSLFSWLFPNMIAHKAWFLMSVCSDTVPLDHCTHPRWVHWSNVRVSDSYHRGRRLITQPGPIATNLEQAANLLYAQVNSASYPQWDGKWVVTHLVWATGWRPSAGGWGDGVLVIAALQVQLSVSAANVNQLPLPTQ